jgi:hypothetical protein
VATIVQPYSISERSAAMARAERLDAVEMEIRARAPRAAARMHVSLSNPPARSTMQVLMRLAGSRRDQRDGATRWDAAIGSAGDRE